MKKSLGAKTILYPMPVMVVGTYDDQGEPNVMLSAWGGIVSSNPPSVAISLRKATYSYNHILHRKGFTISIPAESQVREADFFGIVSGKNENKFEVSEFKAVRSDLVDAPYIEEFPLVLECRLTHTLELGMHTQFVGEIMDVKVDESALNSDGLPDLAKLKPLCYAPELRTYHGLGPSLGKAYSIGKTLPGPEPESSGLS